MAYEFPRSAPEEQGVPSAVVADVLKSLDALEYMKGIIILRHGSIISESYWSPYDSETPHALWSLSKSFTSCAVGLAREEKLLSLENKLIDFFPEYRSCVTDEKMFGVSLRDLLTMRSGHAQCAFQYARLDSANDWVRGFLSSPLQYAPGTHFAYNSLGTYMLSSVIRRVTGLNVREYLLPRLFEPLEITPGVWESCPAGTNYGGFGLHLKTRDIAKFAQLILNKGCWLGQQLLPEAYLSEALQAHADNSMNEHPDWKCGYGYQFWRSRHGFRGDGACGQYAVVLPEEDMAVAVNGTMSEMGRVLEIFWKKLLPALKEEPLEEDFAGISKLASVSRSMRIAPFFPGEKACETACSFEFFPNAAGIKNGAIRFFPEKCILSLNTPRGTEEICAGFGRFEKSTFQLQDFRAHPAAGCASWKDNNTLKIDLFFLDSTFRDTWTLEFRNSTVYFKWQTKCSLFRPLLPPLAVRHLEKA